MVEKRGDMAEAKVGGKCDFNCDKGIEPMVHFENTDTGHKWTCHLSCLREHLKLHDEFMGVET